MLIEANVDAIVGPTHHFGGLGVGNVASIEHRQQPSHPKLAALEGVAKAALVARLGPPQFVWLPPIRPQLELLDRIGFRGSTAQKLLDASRSAPRVLSAAYSSAFMWAANAATVSPAIDAADHRFHITPANLISSWHRATEAGERGIDIRQMFGQGDGLQLHAPLPSIVPLRDEGAANHMRLSDPSGRLGFNVFVYGEDEQAAELPERFMPRQTRAAAEAIARQHQLDPQTTFYLRQHPRAVSAGAFHNDVVATSHHRLLIHHEHAFIAAEAELTRLEETFLARTGAPLLRVVIDSRELPLSTAIDSYFFNSQLLSGPGNSGQMTLLCPVQCQATAASRLLIERLIADPQLPLDGVRFVSLAESMANGGGPACLRLRLPVDADGLALINPQLRMDDDLAARLTAAIERYYPERIDMEDLARADFAEFAVQAVRELRRAVER